MATEILAVGSTAASSSDVVVTDAITVSLKGETGMESFVYIELKDDAAAYHARGYLDSYESARSITAPGTYRFTRRAGATCGVFSG